MTTAVQEEVRKDAFLLTFPMEILQEQASEGGEGDQQAGAELTSEGVNKVRFKGRVNSGGVIPNHWRWGNFAIRLSGIDIQRQSMAVLKDHSKEIGFTDRVWVDKEHGLMCEGFLLDANEAGKEVIAMLKAGMPWQMSCYVPPTKLMKLEAGEETEVNGYTLSGPAHIFEACTLRECTVTALGADQNTDVAAFHAQAVRGEQSLETVPVSIHTLSHEEDMTKKESAVAEDSIPRAEADQLAANAAEKARLEERERIAGIDKAASGFGVKPEFLQELKDNGTSLADAQGKILDHVREHKADALAAFRKDKEKSTGVESTETADEVRFEETRSAAKAKADPQTEEEFKANEALFEEFDGDFKGYQAYRRNTKGKE